METELTSIRWCKKISGFAVCSEPRLKSRFRLCAKRRPSSKTVPKQCVANFSRGSAMCTDHRSSCSPDWPTMQLPLKMWIRTYARVRSLVTQNYKHPQAFLSFLQCFSASCNSPITAKALLLVMNLTDSFNPRRKTTGHPRDVVRCWCVGWDSSCVRSLYAHSIHYFMCFSIKMNFNASEPKELISNPGVWHM